MARGSQSQPSSNSDALAGPSQPLNEKFHETPVNAPINKGKRKYPEEASTVEEDVRHMEMETDALRRAAILLTRPLPTNDTLLPLAPCETP